MLEKKIIATGQHISHSDETCPCFFLQGITYNQVVTACPQLVGRVLYWQRSGGPVSFCCLAGEQVLDTRTFKVYSSFDDLAQTVAQGQGRVPMTSITLALAPNSPTLQCKLCSSMPVRTKKTFRFQSCSKHKKSRVKTSKSQQQRGDLHSLLSTHPLQQNNRAHNLKNQKQQFSHRT